MNCEKPDAPRPNAWPEQEEHEGAFAYRKNADQSVTITAYMGRERRVDVPEALAGLRVAALGDEAFFQNEGVEHVALPHGLKAIGDYAFYGCRRLTSVDIPDSVTYIGKGAFYGAGLRQIELPDDLTALEEGVLQDCRELTTARLPARLRKIGRNALSGTALRQLALPEGVEEIDYGAFAYCDALQEATIPACVRRLEWDVFAGCLALETVTLAARSLQCRLNAPGDCTAVRHIRAFRDSWAATYYASFPNVALEYLEER